MGPPSLKKRDASMLITFSWEDISFFSVESVVWTRWVTAQEMME